MNSEIWAQSLSLSPSIMTLPSPPSTQCIRGNSSPPESPSKDPPPPKRHPLFYLHGMSTPDAVVLQVEDTLFRLSMFGLVQQIGLFRDTLSLPRGTGNAGEGESDSLPIVVPGISSEIFSFIINTLFGRYDSNPTIPHLLAGLDYSLTWVIPNLRSYTIDHLTRSSIRIHPGIMLSYGRRHAVLDWIEPAVRHLVNRPFSTYDSEVVNTISSDTLIVIARLRERLEQLRVHLSLRGPTVFHTSECKDDISCNNAWDNAWLTTVGRKLLHPDDLFRPTLSEIKSFAETIKVPGMTSTCFEAVSRGVRETDPWDFEAKAVSRAVDLLMVPSIELKLPLISDGMEMVFD